MKTFLFLTGMAIAAYLGYRYEPELRETLTGEIPVASTSPVNEGSVEEEDLGLASKTETEEALETEVSQISPPSEIEANRIDSTAIVEEAPQAAQEEIEVEPPSAEPIQESLQEPEGQEEIEEQEGARQDVEPVQESAEVAVPEEAEESIAPVRPEGAAGNVVAIMQESVRSGKITAFTYDQVLDWKDAQQSEDLNGTQVAIGLASYQAETVFGVKTIEAKAMIAGGRVVKWVWPKSGVEIK